MVRMFQWISPSILVGWPGRSLSQPHEPRRANRAFALRDVTGWLPQPAHRTLAIGIRQRDRADQRTPESWLLR
jgi:hypothetical protein